MRSMLVNWIVSVHRKHKLWQETLYLTVNYLDRYTERRQLTKNNYQQVGITCLHIAAKYEEIYPPQLR